MSVREYIGARYIPMFADPIEWDITSIYEPLTVVQYQGGSYVSRREVPAGIELDNTDYWILWADFNAQLQHYIDEVNTFDGRIDALEAAMPITDFDNVDTVKSALSDIADLLPASEFDSTNTVDARFDGVDSRFDTLEAKLPASAFDSTNTVNAKFTVIENRLSNLEPKTDFVIIGDSYSRVGDGLSTSDYWWYKLSQKLGLTPHNFSVGGCGFVQGTTPYITQISNAAADTSFDNNDVGLLIIYGGVNDCYNNFSIGGYITIIENALALAKTSFPNAQIILAGINTFAAIWTKQNYTTSGVTIYHTTKALEERWEMAALETFGVMFIPFMRQMVAQTQWFQNSGTGHPNAKGQTVIANIFINALRGIQHLFQTARTVFLSDTNTQLLGTGSIACTFNSFNIGFYGININVAQSSGGSYLTIAEIPYGLEGMLPGGMDSTAVPIAITCSSTIEKNNITWAYVDNVPSGYTPTATKFVQHALIITKHPDVATSNNLRMGGY